MSCPLTNEERELIIALKRQGKPIKEIMSITGRGHSIISKIGKQNNLNAMRPARHNWTEREKGKAINMYSLGSNYQEISGKLRTRSPGAVKVFLSRRRSRIIRDPQKIKVLKVLSFCTNPALILKFARESGFMDRLDRLEGQNASN